MLEVRRSKAYKMARQYRASGGRQGLPVFQLGRCLRVPAWALWSSPVRQGRQPLRACVRRTDCRGRLPASEILSWRHPGFDRVRPARRVRRTSGPFARCRRRPVVVALVRSSSSCCSRGLRSSCSRSPSSSVRSGSADKCPCGRSGVGSDAAGDDDPRFVGGEVGGVLHAVLDRQRRVRCRACGAGGRQPVSGLSGTVDGGAVGAVVVGP